MLFCDNYKESIRQINELSTKPKIMTDEDAEQQIRVAITADPQVAVLSKLSGIDEELIMFALVIFLAVLVELTTSLGVYGFSRSLKKSDPKTEKTEPASPRKFKVV